MVIVDTLGVTWTWTQQSPQKKTSPHRRTFCAETSSDMGVVNHTGFRENGYMVLLVISYMESKYHGIII